MPVRSIGCSLVLSAHVDHYCVLLSSTGGGPATPAAATLEAKLRREGVDASSVVGSERDRSVPERFSSTKHSQWSAYNMDRRDERHDRTLADVDEQ